jgi:soluble lytic murein transglycosylase-like protein
MYACILFYSFLNGLDPALTQSVISVESRGNPYALGKASDSGLMQIRPIFVPETQQQLFSPCTNIMRGTQLLGKLKLKYRFDKAWYVAYNTGERTFRKLKRPMEFAYYKKVQREYIRLRQMPVQVRKIVGYKARGKNDLRELPAYVYSNALARR